MVDGDRVVEIQRLVEQAKEAPVVGVDSAWRRAYARDVAWLLEALKRDG